MLSLILQNKYVQMSIVCILSLALGGFFGWSKRGAIELSKQHKQELINAQETLRIQQEYNANLIKVTESSEAQSVKIAVLQGELINEREKNIKLLNDNNRITKQFTRMYDASTTTKVSVTGGKPSDATTASSVSPDRVLQVMQQNNIDCQKYINQLNAWIYWYNLNSKVK